MDGYERVLRGGRPCSKLQCASVGVGMRAETGNSYIPFFFFFHL